VSVQPCTKNVPLDIAVGNDTAEKPHAPAAASAPPVSQALPVFAPVITTVPPPVVANVPGFVPTQRNDAVDVCAPLDPTKPSPAQASPEVEGPATAGKWAFRNQGSYTVDGVSKPLAADDARTVSNVAGVGPGQFAFMGSGVTFGFSNTASQWLASNSTSAPANPLVSPTSYVGLMALDIAAPSGFVMFHPEHALLILSTPAQQASTYQPDPSNPAIPNTTGSWTDTQADAEHGTSITIQGADLGKVRVNACGTPVDAWEVQATITIVSREVWGVAPTPAKTELTLSVTYAVATGLGGMIVAETVKDAANPDASPGLLGGATYAIDASSTISKPKPDPAS
jgi:hypothetical protein